MSPLGRVYLTGDLASWTAQGLRLLGRRDGQLKVSGVRVEGREVEEAVEASGLVAHCACLVRPEGLVAHVAMEGSMDWLVRAALEAHAAKRLPSQVGRRVVDHRNHGFRMFFHVFRWLSMVFPLLGPSKLEVVPHLFVCHAQLPLAPGGKVDREALASLAPQAEPAPEALQGGLETAVAGAWAHVLRRPLETIGANANFLWLGGDSLAALRVSRRLQEGLQLPEAEQRGEAGLMVPAEAPEDAVCVLSAALGPLAPCELLARR